MRKLFVFVLSALFVGVPALADAPASATRPPSPRQHTMTTTPPPGIEASDQSDTSIATRRFFDAFPDMATAQQVYDNLDLARAVNAL